MWGMSLLQTGWGGVYVIGKVEGAGGNIILQLVPLSDFWEA